MYPDSKTTTVVAAYDVRERDAVVVVRPGSAVAGNPDRAPTAEAVLRRGVAGSCRNDVVRRADPSRRTLPCRNTHPGNYNHSNQRLIRTEVSIADATRTV